MTINNILPIEAEIQSIILEPLKALGYKIVRVKLLELENKTLQIMIERLDQNLISIDDCTKASHLVSTLLEVNDPIESAYHLELSSPGIERPLMTLDDFINYCNCEIKLTIKSAEISKKNVKAKITAVNDQKISLLIKEKLIEVEFSSIISAKLVYSKELVNRKIS